MNAITFKHNGASCAVRLFEPYSAQLVSLYSHNRGRGEAKEVIKQATEWADRWGVTLYIYVQEFGRNPGLSNKELEKFYTKLGFVRHKDHTVFNRRMLRPPSQELQAP